MKILNIAHRGFSSKYPENTLLAFREGMQAGADGFECDLRLTADGHVVVFHDDDLKRLCGQKGSIESLPLSEVRKLRVFGREPIPTLEDMLLEFHTTRINLEIKMSQRDAVVVETVLRTLTKVRPSGEILFSSFSPEVIRSLNVMNKDHSLGKHGLLVETSCLALLPEMSAELQPSTWNVPKQIMNAPWDKRWGLEMTPPLWIWTVDEPDQWARVLRSPLPFEAIITNKPDALSSFLAASG